MYASLLAFEYLSVGYLNLCVVTFSMSGCILYHCSSLLVRWTTDAFKQLVKLGNLGFLYGRFVVIRVASGEAILGLNGMPPGLSNIHSPLFRWQERKSNIVLLVTRMKSNDCRLFWCSSFVSMDGIEWSTNTSVIRHVLMSDTRTTTQTRVPIVFYFASTHL